MHSALLLLSVFAAGTQGMLVSSDVAACRTHATDLMSTMKSVGSVAEDTKDEMVLLARKTQDHLDKAIFALGADNANYAVTQVGHANDKLNAFADMLHSLQVLEYNHDAPIQPAEEALVTAQTELTKHCFSFLIDVEEQL
eukprot:CAMPEP_0170739072 /NCGR_PEP_ID=MMETSP0437-20130122/4972_1 /TAXON_ID=0 /ORGANISM="Sexangularia sp." /LENGTH=139 /DNA_ID=CAMNT_0011077515 /DNA_START=74 /DNA_END=493 /DNA_ORIENTATION=-